MYDKIREEDAASPYTSSDRLEKLARMNGNLAMIVAKNPATPPELLAKLYWNSTPFSSMRRNIVLNPNVPIDLIWQLILEFPQEILSNPIFNDLLKSNPDLVKESPDETFINLLKSEHIPDLFLDYASKQTDRRIVLSILMNPKTSLTHLVNLFEKFSSLYYERNSSSNEDRDNWDILFNIDNHVSWEQELKPEWQDEVLSYIFKAHYVDPNDKQYLTKLLKAEIDDLSQYVVNDSFADSTYKNICRQFLEKTSSILQQQQKTSDIEEKLSLAKTTKNIKTFTQLLKESDKDFEIKKAMLTNPNLPQKILVEILDRLMKRTNCISLIKYDSFRQALKQAKIPSQILEQMAEQKDEEWHLFVAEHPNTPNHILEKYAQSSNNKLICNVAKNSNTSKNIFSQIADIDDWDIQYAIKKNPSTPVSLLKKLASHNKFSVNEHIAHSPTPSGKEIEILAQNPSNDFRLSYQDNTPTEILKKIVLRADHSRTLMHIVQNPNSDDEILEILAEDIDYEVRFFVARDAKTPLHILEKLAEDSNDEVRYEILTNPNFTREAFLRLFRQIFGIENYSLGGLLLLLAPNVSPVFLEENADSLLWIERYVIAIHPQTSVDILQRLAKDTNRYVRAAALERC
ncbi:hypothetical protein [Rivularia sp. UHCC 0363]|uniref:hypothetical protein n=1 Tax=Rivularia sp. UHCC 0363 TaxID=3110244 RepID=UPI002B21C273|nr:hypothetical protein [Rivularia sp. UHCC 0363]MEA5593221.1 hypothetical protein [Rivularia sp. UHCC 0363]